MHIFINILVPIICLLIGYLLGSVSFSILIGKVFYHQDPRDFGSKNAGGTNAGRLWGKKVGLTVVILDMLKTIAPMWICWAILTYVPFGDKPLLVSTELYYTPLKETYTIQWPVYLLANLGCLFGHCWPIFSNFKGGKGASAFMGTILGSSWGVGWLPALAYFPILKKTKYVSLTTMLTGVFSVILSWLWVILVLCNVIPHGYEWIIMFGPTINCTWQFALILTTIVIIMIFRHHANIKRIIEGNENKIKWMK